MLLRYDRFPEALALNPDGTAGTADGVLLRQDGDAIWMDRAADHQSTRLIPSATAPTERDIAGTYRCEELDAVLTIVDAGNVLYGAFSGFLGQVPNGASHTCCERYLDLTVPARPRSYTPRRLDHRRQPRSDRTVGRNPVGLLASREI